ncbi:MAG: hypothetical protein BWY31_01811 [Lentisphaerae bacterium ADurb.Bin242]|nr:MAG: hypothetical protein BWY31_01811 [Lentisphaerae bacterium ADurb.Bin242]
MHLIRNTRLLGREILYAHPHAERIQQRHHDDSSGQGNPGEFRKDFGKGGNPMQFASVLRRTEEHVFSGAALRNPERQAEFQIPAVFRRFQKCFHDPVHILLHFYSIFQENFR